MEFEETFLVQLEKYLVLSFLEWSPGTGTLDGTPCALYPGAYGCLENILKVPPHPDMHLKHPQTVCQSWDLRELAQKSPAKQTRSKCLQS